MAGRKVDRRWRFRRVPSAFDAVQWAADVQHAVPIQNADDGLPAIVLRIAVHVGDIITTEIDVFGDGVNLAARLQEHAPAAASSCPGPFTILCAAASMRQCGTWVRWS